ncbi:class I SAM-dependent methyltransferase [Flavobacterium sp.]|uniref:class I SAM-dependent methyltransferase n=1 Tax=Flavobacterium sp. TaxID=239 RepID=UPI0035283917
MTEQDFFNRNKQAWNNKVPVHITSEFYDQKSFISGKNSLPNIDLNLLGDVSNLSILHLQCHFGQDTLSLARMGAQVTGIDLSDKAIDTAKKLNDELQLNAQFVCCNVYDTRNYIKQQFDIVYTSYGTIGWLPDLDRWAKVIVDSLKPGGKFIFVEFHPVIWMFDDDFTKIQYHYHNEKPIIETFTGTYAQKDAEIQTDYVGWNHSLAEVISSLLKQGLEIKSFEEYDYSPYNCFNKTFEFEKGKFRIKGFENKLPMLYSITAIKK